MFPHPPYIPFVVPIVVTPKMAETWTTSAPLTSGLGPSCLNTSTEESSWYWKWLSSKNWNRDNCKPEPINNTPDRTCNIRDRTLVVYGRRGSGGQHRWFIKRSVTVYRERPVVMWTNSWWLDLYVSRTPLRCLFLHSGVRGWGERKVKGRL